MKPLISLRHTLQETFTTQKFMRPSVHQVTISETSVTQTKIFIFLAFEKNLMSLLLKNYPKS